MSVPANISHKSLSILEASITRIDVHEAEIDSLLSENVQRAACRILPWWLSNLALVPVESCLFVSTLFL
jgi:hypothetical protein